MLLLEGKHFWDKGRGQSRCHSSPALWDMPWINRKGAWKDHPDSSICSTGNLHWPQTFKMHWNSRTTSAPHWGFEDPQRTCLHPVSFLLLATSCCLLLGACMLILAKPSPSYFSWLPGSWFLNCARATYSPERGDRVHLFPGCLHSRAQGRAQHPYPQAFLK